MMRRILFQVCLYAHEQKINKNDFGEVFFTFRFNPNERNTKVISDLKLKLSLNFEINDCHLESTVALKLRGKNNFIKHCFN